MQKPSILSVQQVDQIIKQYLFTDISLNQIIKSHIQNNCNLSRAVILNAVKKKIHDFVLDLEKNLWMVKKIMQLKIYDHDSQTLFQPFLLNLKEIIPENCRYQFLQLYKNSKLNSIQIIIQTQYVFVHSDKKLQIYNCFIKYAEKEDLFTKMRMQQKDPTQALLPKQTISQLFPRRDLQLILKTFRQSNNKVRRTYSQLKNLGLSDCEYQNQKDFIVRFDNLLLIGLYFCYSELCRTKLEQPDSWAKFLTRKFDNASFQPFLHILLRAAIRQDISKSQLNLIKPTIPKKIGYKYQKSSKMELLLNDSKNQTEN